MYKNMSKYTYSFNEGDNTLLHLDQDVLSSFGILVPEMKNIELKMQQKKSKMPSGVIGLLLKYKETENVDFLENTTFRYITIYKTTGTVCGRLSVGLSDFGFTQKEIDQMTLAEIIENIINRK
jgi:hypothetical protein